MADQPPSTRPHTLPPHGIAVKDGTVNLGPLVPVMAEFLAALGEVHATLFGSPAVVTSAVDGSHTPASKHYKGQAVDFRVSTYTGQGYITFLGILLALAKRYTLAVFDESNLPGAGHIHVEVAG